MTRPRKRPEANPVTPADPPAPEAGDVFPMRIQLDLVVHEHQISLRDRMNAVFGVMEILDITPTAARPAPAELPADCTESHSNKKDRGA